MLWTFPSNAGGVSSITVGGTKIPQVSWPRSQNMKQKQCHNKFIGDFENGPYQEKKENLKKIVDYSVQRQTFRVLLLNRMRVERQ